MYALTISYQCLLILLTYVTGEWWFKVVCSWNWDWRDATSRCSWCKQASMIIFTWSTLIIFSTFSFIFIFILFFKLYLPFKLFPPFVPSPSILVHWLQSWRLQLKELILLVLGKQRLSHGEVQACGTPRRLLVQWYSSIFFSKMMTIFFFFSKRENRRDDSFLFL